MKIKIIKATSEEAWYTGLIGEIFEVTGKTRNGKHYYVIHDDTTGLFCVNKEDCEDVTMEETKEFKVGDEVSKLKPGDPICILETSGLASHYKGETEATLLHKRGSFWVVRMNDGHTQYLREDQIEPKEPVLTKAEALKLCIDGAFVVNEETDENHYIYWNGKDFMTHSTFGNDWKTDGFLDAKQWKLWTPPTPPKPKFSIGQFVADNDNDYVLIESMEYKDSEWVYTARYGTLVGDIQESKESELSEVTQ